MKKLIILISTVSLIGLIGCDFLDVVPNDAATLDHAFSNRSVTEKFLRTCYSGQPDITAPFSYPGWLTTRDEVDWGQETRAAATNPGYIAQGRQNASSPYLNYWSGINGGKNLYVAIRDCNIFLENVHIPTDIDEIERERWTAEVKFLKAFYHFFLMKLYGPIVLVDENHPLSATPEETMDYREPIDVVVDFIVDLMDDAIENGLPETLPDPNTEYGRIDQTVAKAYKAQVLVWAASPLFNGNSDYKGWVDNRGLQLIPDKHDNTKWERAAVALKEAIDHAHNLGYKLYEFQPMMGGPQTYAMNDTVARMMTIRKAITEDIDINTGVIWSCMDTWQNSKGITSFTRLSNFPNMMMPPLYSEDQNMYPYFHASWHLNSLFYSNNGVPIEEDKDYPYDDRFELRRATPGDKHESYIATGETTVGIHFFREPRFYANISFDRATAVFSTTTEDGGATFAPFCKFRYGELVGTHKWYTAIKLVPFEASGSQGDASKSFNAYNYSFPLIRLADLYLLYSEALNEAKSEPDHEVYHWIDLVREKAGLKGVVESWTEHSVNPSKPIGKVGMRDIIRQERMIELAFEGIRFWDLRRWKTADQYWTKPPMRWSMSKIPEEYYVAEEYGPVINMTFRDLLWPVREYDLRINKNLVQTYGW